MKFSAERYRIEDIPNKPFIDEEEILEILKNTVSDKVAVRDVIQKSLAKNRLSLYDTAVLLKTTDPELIEEIKQSAAKLKNEVYGNRIVLFAPLYVGNKCVNDCKYCGFRASNSSAERLTLTTQQVISEVKALEENGQKRLILVFGEHPEYDAQYIADTVKTVYSIKTGPGEIRRININAAPLDSEGFKIVHESGIGTYQIFQETYHRETYKYYHAAGRKSNYDYRLLAFDRALQSGLDDVGIGVLFGLYDWRFEVMALVRHTNHLEACFNVGPHTISFPRLQHASSVNINQQYKVTDNDFEHVVSVLRLAVPYTGLILTAREPEQLRRKLINYGVSQIDGGTKIKLGSYTEKVNYVQDENKAQFQINDNRSLNDVIDELLAQDQLPSFCTACYRLKRTGEHFMEFSVPGFIKRFCSPNAMLTLAEYLEDYAPEETAKKGWEIIDKNLEALNGHVNIDGVKERLERIKKGERDIYF